MTAAHCQHARIPRLQIAEVVLGDWDLEHDPDCAPDCEANSQFQKSQRFNVTAADVIVHESWDLTKVVDSGNDIAIIRLPREAITSNENLHQTVLPACLDWDRGNQNPADIYIVTGWGKTNNNLYDIEDFEVSGTYSSKLRRVKVSIIPLDQCISDFYSKGQDITSEGIICAEGIKGKGSCLGDSGGPLIAIRNGIYFLEGITSFGDKLCATEIPSVYTSIKYFIPWIKEKIQYFESKHLN